MKIKETINEFFKIGKTAIIETVNWLNGKKTIIGSVLTGAVMIADGIKPELMNDKVYNGLLILFASLFGTGLVHKGAKTETGKKLIELIKK